MQSTNYNVNEIDIPTLGKFQQVHLLHQMQNSLHCNIGYCQVVEMVEPVEYLRIQLETKSMTKDMSRESCFK